MGQPVGFSVHNKISGRIGGLPELWKTENQERGPSSRTKNKLLMLLPPVFLSTVY